MANFGWVTVNPTDVDPMQHLLTVGTSIPLDMTGIKAGAVLVRWSVCVKMLGTNEPAPVFGLMAWDPAASQNHIITESTGYMTASRVGVAPTYAWASGETTEMRASGSFLITEANAKYRVGGIGTYGGVRLVCCNHPDMFPAQIAEFEILSATFNTQPISCGLL